MLDPKLAREALLRDLAEATPEQLIQRLKNAIPKWAKEVEEMKEDAKLDKLKSAIDSYFSDTSRSQVETLDGLCYLRDELCTLIDCIEHDLGVER